MRKTKTFDVWVAIDAAGEVAVGLTREDAVGGIDADQEHRTVKVEMTVPVPEVPHLAAVVTVEEMAVLAKASAA